MALTGMPKLKTIFSSPRPSSKFRSDVRNHRDARRRIGGFSLVEILVALFLMVLIVSMFFVGPNWSSPRQNLESALDNVERAVRFASDESTVRNRVVRLTFQLDEEPHQFSVEYGPDQDFVLPKRLFEIGERRTLKEIEEDTKMLEELSRQFSKVEEFEDESVQFSEEVRVVAVASTLGDTFLTEGDISLYFYPTGEKDAALVTLSTETEMATLEIEAFTMNFERTIVPIDSSIQGNDANLEDDLYNTQLEMARESYQKWLK